MALTAEDKIISRLPGVDPYTESINLGRFLCDDAGSNRLKH